MGTNYNDIGVSQETENKIKSKAPDNIPLNATAQGWTGQGIRRKLVQYVLDNQDSILSVLKSQLEIVKNHFIEEQLPNREILEKFSVVDGKLLYEGQPIEAEEPENQEVLDKFTESPEGKPLYNGQPISGDGSGITTFVGTREEYNVANSAGQIPSGILVIITDEEEEIPNSSATAVLGMATLGSMILGHI